MGPFYRKRAGGVRQTRCKWKHVLMKNKSSDLPEAHIPLSVWGPCTWKMLHCMAHTWYSAPTAPQQEEMRTLLLTLASLLPCTECSHHFRAFLAERLEGSGNLDSKEKLVALLNDAHNEVNLRRGKRAFSLREHYGRFSLRAARRGQWAWWLGEVVLLVALVAWLLRPAQTATSGAQTLRTLGSKEETHLPTPEGGGVSWATIKLGMPLSVLYSSGVTPALERCVASFLPCAEAA